MNGDRLGRIRDHIAEAQRLAQQEAHDTHMDRRVTRLSLGLHLCRELADDIFEAAVVGAHQDHGRQPRHC